MTRRFCLALAVAASLAVHVKGLWAPLLDYHFHRQCNTADIARNYHKNGLHFGTPQVDWEGDYEGKAATEFPLYMWLMGLFWPIGGFGEHWGRILSAAFSALTAAYLFLLCEKRMERRAALYASVLFSFIPLEIYFGRTVQPEALALLSTTAALYHWDRWLDDPGKLWHWTAAALFAFLAFAHKLPYLYLLLPLAALAWAAPKRRAWLDPTAWTACVLALAGVAGWYKYASTGVFVVPSHKEEFTKMLEYDKILYFIFFQFFSRLPELAATYAGMVLGAVGAWRLIGKQKETFFAYWWAAVAVSLIIGGGYAHWHEYTSLPFAPVNAALMGAGLWWLEQKTDKLPAEKRSPARWGLALLVLSIPVHAVLRIHHWYRNGYPYLTQAGPAAAAVSAPGDLFVCNERTSSTFLFYLDRKGWAWSVKEAGPAQSIALLDEKIKAGAKFYASAKSMLEEPGLRAFRDYLADHARPVYDKDDLEIFRLKGS